MFATRDASRHARRAQHGLTALVALVALVALALCLCAAACSSDGSASQRRVPDMAAPASPNAGQGGASPMPGAAAIDNGAGGQIDGPAAAPTGPGGGNACEVVQLKANPQIPEMMIVLDRSGSMMDGRRWGPSVSAVKSLTQELQDRVDFGLTLFPDPANQDVLMQLGNIGSCLFSPDPQACLDMFGGADPACAPGLTVVPIAPSNAGNIGGVLDMTLPAGGTPTSETLQSLLQSYAAVEQDPDAVRPPKYVLLVTDGQPTCPAGQGRDTTPADVDASNAAIEALAMADVATYVIGYDTTSPGNEALAQVLDGFAQRGNTGDMQHRPVEDEASLLAELQTITGDIASCSFDLDSAPVRPDYVLVELDGEKVQLDDPNGWMLVGDRTIELIGNACQTFKDGTHLIDVTVQCAPVG